MFRDTVMNKKLKIKAGPVKIRKVWAIKPQERVKRDNRRKLKEKARRRESTLP